MTTKKTKLQPPLRFIVVDDDLFALTLEEKLIQGFDECIEAMTFSSARDALKFIVQEYNLIENIISTVLVTDLHMPETDGLALLDNIEELDQAITGQLHAFVLSAAASPEEIEKVLAHKCVKGFYSKPLCVETIKQILDTIRYPR